MLHRAESCAKLKEETTESLKSNIKLRTFSKSCREKVKELNNRMNYYCCGIEALPNFGRAAVAFTTNQKLRGPDLT